ncbi:hypothetical protein PENSTE_c017G04314 [Penicillium steckii]|uniref:Uncharacterized protein n=1 Tax=Penicillium steckii TaxID=303698 RepID=A0A1V6SXI4_9EURO|nr:hypothetical protein PENSTE_c017G04314 [Penicillium steckii]
MSSLLREHSVSKFTNSPSSENVDKPLNDANIVENVDDSPPEMDSGAWWRSMATSTIWASLCIHWSLEQGMGIPNGICAFSAFIAEAWEIRDMSKNTGLKT